MAGTTVEETEQYSVAASFVTAASEAVIIVRVRTLAAEFKEEIVAYGMNLMMLLAQLTLTDIRGESALGPESWGIPGDCHSAVKTIGVQTSAFLKRPYFLSMPWR